MHTCSKINSFLIQTTCNGRNALQVAGYTVSQLPAILSQIFNVFLTSHYANYHVQVCHHSLFSNSLPYTISTISRGTL
jgi:hypothetical protein